MNDALSIGQQLVELCKQGKAREAMATLYSNDIVSIEAMSNPNFDARQVGLAAVERKADWWFANHEIHSAKTEGPWPHGDRFIVRFTYEVTPKNGPFAGQRITIDEAALYTVKNGKITQEEFFYAFC